MLTAVGSARFRYSGASETRHALALYFVFSNFCRSHKTLRMTPAMAAGVAVSHMELIDIVAPIDAREPAPKKRGPYKPRKTVTLI
jgi:hypothetical protein